MTSGKKISGSDGGTCIGTTKTERQHTVEAGLSTAGDGVCQGCQGGFKYV